MNEYEHDPRPRCSHLVVFPLDNCAECIKLNFQEKLTTLEKVLERCNDTRAVLLAQRDKAEHLNARLREALSNMAEYASEYLARRRTAFGEHRKAEQDRIETEIAIAKELSK